MKNIKIFEEFDNEKQFNKIISDGLIGNDESFWKIFNDLKVEIIYIIGTQNNLYKEFQQKIINNEDPTEVIY